MPHGKLHMITKVMHLGYDKDTIKQGKSTGYCPANKEQNFNSKTGIGVQEYKSNNGQLWYLVPIGDSLCLCSKPSDTNVRL
jgi:hypothetical protein